MQHAVFISSLIVKVFRLEAFETFHWDVLHHAAKGIEKSNSPDAKLQDFDDDKAHQLTFTHGSLVQSLLIEPCEAPLKRCLKPLLEASQ